MCQNFKFYTPDLALLGRVAMGILCILHLLLSHLIQDIPELQDCCKTEPAQML